MLTCTIPVRLYRYRCQMKIVNNDLSVPAPELGLSVTEGRVLRASQRLAQSCHDQVLRRTRILYHQQAPLFYVRLELSLVLSVLISALCVLSNISVGAGLAAVLVAMPLLTVLASKPACYQVIFGKWRKVFRKWVVVKIISSLGLYAVSLWLIMQPSSIEPTVVDFVLAILGSQVIVFGFVSCLLKNLVKNYLGQMVFRRRRVSGSLAQRCRLQGASPNNRCCKCLGRQEIQGPSLQLSSAP